MKCRTITGLYFFLLILLSGCNDSQNIIIDAATSIYLSPTAESSVKRAVRDLASDMEKVFGQKPEVVSDVMDCAPTCILITNSAELPEEVQPPVGNERVYQKSMTKPFNGISKAFILSGSDERGIIYSIYDFAEKFLGVDPLYWWTDSKPESRKHVKIPVDYEFISDSPTIRYRGLFINDEDLLTGWRPGTWNLSGIDPAVWDRLYETLLRLKGNMIVPGTFIFPYEPQVKAAGERGLIISQHHAEVLGLNVYRWPDDIKYSFQSNREKLISAWTKAVEQYPKDQEILWTVGYRGRHDRAFWEDEKDPPASKKERANIIREAIETQIEIVKKYRENPYFVMNSWGEGIDFIKNGYLELPEEVTLVWADGGWGIIRDDGNLDQGNGIYYHVAMFNHKSNQLTEMVPVSRIQSELTRAIKSGATEYFLLNTSDFKPVMMSAKAAMDISWNAKPWLRDPDYHKTYVKNWSADQFGEDLHKEISKLYAMYYVAPAKYGPDETYRMGDNYYTRMSRLYLRRMETGDTTTYMEKVDWEKSIEENARMLIDLCQEAQPRWDSLYSEAVEIYGRVPAERKNFYQAHLVTPIAIHRFGNKMLTRVMMAYLEPEIETKKNHLRRALNLKEQVIESFSLAEYGKWENFYQNDFMTGFRSAGKCIELTISKYEGKKTHENIDHYINDWDLWDHVKSYQGKQRVPM